jgi:hypothetical protein
MTFVDPHQITTGDSFEDSRIALNLVREEIDGERKTVRVPLTEALAFDNAYDHYSAVIGTLDGDAGVYYTR